MVTSTKEKQAATKTDKVHAEPGRLLAEEHRWSECRSRIVASIAAAEVTAGARVLDGGEAALRAQADSLASQKAEVAGCDAAIAEARRRRVLAIGAVWQADASALRRQAQALRSEASERQAKVDALLSELGQLEGATYSNAASQDWRPDFQTDQSVPVDGVSVILVATPKTAGLVAEAVRLDAEAAALEHRQVVMAGALRADSREALLGELHGFDSLTIGPTLADMEAWLDVAEPPVLEALRIRTARMGARASLLYEVSWAHGELDKVRSHVTLREHAGHVAGPTPAA